MPTPTGHLARGEAHHPGTAREQEPAAAAAADQDPDGRGRHVHRRRLGAGTSRAEGAAVRAVCAAGPPLTSTSSAPPPCCAAVDQPLLDGAALEPGLPLLAPGSRRQGSRDLLAALPVRRRPARVPCFAHSPPTNGVHVDDACCNAAGTTGPASCAWCCGRRPWARRWRTCGSRRSTRCARPPHGGGPHGTRQPGARAGRVRGQSTSALPRPARRPQRVMPHAPSSAPAVAIKLLLDQLAMAPLGTALFLAGMKVRGAAVRAVEASRRSCLWRRGCGCRL